jgi:predicted dehydrogenase
MIDRRDFLQMTIGAAAAASARPVTAASPQATGVIGANARIRVGLIGCGGRGNQVARDWMKHKDSVFVAACDVYKERLDETVARIAGVQGTAPDAYEDYRRILERKDVDAVFIATPDHWHGPMTVDACAAGKDVYVEKPVSNEIEPGLQMIEAARRHARIVQVGLQQRSWHHFQEAQRLFRDGYIGSPVTHCQMIPPGGGGFPGRGAQPQTPQAPPAGLNWEMFQGPAARKPFLPGRLNWRGWYDYGGGNLSDWGVHLTDIMNWFMQADDTAPLLTSASAQYVRIPRDPERVPDTYSVTWQYKDFVATLSNAMVPGTDDPRQLYGNQFFGDRGVLIVNRLGYEVRPYPAPGARPGQPPPAPPLEAKRFKDPNGMSEVAESKYGSATHRHVRNFLDAVKSRQRPVCDVEVGFYSTLPCLLALVSVKTGRTVTWDGKAARTT